MVPAARFGRRDLLVWVVPGSRANFFRHAQSDQEASGTELIGAQPIRRTDTQAEWRLRCNVCSARNYFAPSACVKRTLDNPPHASIRRKTFSCVRFKASLWVRFRCEWVIGYSELRWPGQVGVKSQYHSLT